MEEGKKKKGYDAWSVTKLWLWDEPRILALARKGKMETVWDRDVQEKAEELNGSV